tara:strand:+ start:48 stop:287 length:240 start_codon:yes stop_codon:yes gene_type:complete
VHPKKGKLQTIKDIITDMESIHNGRWNWYKKSPGKSQDDSCYQGLFWDCETETFLRWKELQKRQETHTDEKKDISTTNT